MQYEFLKQFPRRMKHVGRYVLLLQNSSQKGTWKKYGFIKSEEQINLIFAVLLYVMEQSLKEEVCTMDDIGAYIDNLNMQFFEKNMSYEDSKLLGDFILNVVLSNEGKPMYFDGYDFELKAYQIMHISYVANRIVYVDSDLKRTSYYLTEDGYNLLLSTLEIENNMQLTIHEMIFKMHLEKQSYDKAVDEIKNVFQLLRIQMQKIQEAMSRIRRNALNYSVVEYETILDENLDTISDTKKKFQSYRDLVKARAQELDDMNLNVKKLDAKEEEKLKNLRIIEQYLNQTIDEHQKILGSHFDLKSLYTRELEQLSQMSFIKRFSFRNDFYDQIFAHPDSLQSVDLFLRPLFSNDPDKGYNLKKVTELQRPLRKKAREEDDEIMDFGDENWQEEEERRQREKLKKYEESLSFLMHRVMEKGTLSLDEIEREVNENPDIKAVLVPSVDIFKEIMVELIKNKEIDLKALQKERSEYISDNSGMFQLSEMLLSVLDSDVPAFGKIRRMTIYRKEDGKVIVIKDVKDGTGAVRTIKCSNIQIQTEREGE
ncbi:hypothetical protein [Hespellia stercorisuis]|uniref:Uncharacterized protein n=1 Tax=Hespellia stercorisuis DSM 15480 TaxID=1121950 RepID=A0A1M6V402_9FIRM|nr:hypothetical protein [Hespellia stercorisuis]SHK76180.1 hypothetical protein SAMN02745243_03677 [Hespellia stercorisuis DSM 15480]